jgi:hypothetical protein
LGAVLAIQLVGACGGQSFTTGDSPGGNGSGSGSGTDGGSSTTGGSAHSVAGTTSIGGRGSTGGRPGTGAAPGTGGSGIAGSGTGGDNPGTEACNAPAETGNCEAAMPRWFHDPSTGLCRPFTYGGCGGNANNYQSLAECQAACHGGNPNYDACTQPSDCVVTGTGCCGVCDSPDLTAHDFLAYNKKFAESVLACAAVDIACAPCAPQPAGTRKYFVPNCVQGECVVEDVRSSDVTSCKTAQDCQLRHGVSCCEGCGGTGDLIAVRNDGSFEKLVCPSEPYPCPACLPAPPTNASAVCEGGHCIVVYTEFTNE